MKPKITIGLPVYNGADYLDQAIESILSQTFTDFELIIADNASTDSTEEICKKYAHSDNRIFYVRNISNIGAARNFNLCFTLASGQYFKWAAHDDKCHPQYLEKCIAHLKNDPRLVLAWPRTRVIDAQGNVMQNRDDKLNIDADSPSRRFKSLLKPKVHCYPVFGLIKTSILAQTGKIGRFVSADRVLLAELALRGPFHQIDEYLFYRRDLFPTMNRYPNIQTHATWFDPAWRKHFVTQDPRLLKEYIKALDRANLPADEYFLCLGALSGWLYRRKRKFAGELYHYMKFRLIGQSGKLRKPVTVRKTY